VLPAGFTPAIAAAWTITPGHKGHYNYISPDGQLTVHSEEDAYYSGMKHNQPFGGRLGSTTTAKAHNTALARYRRELQRENGGSRSGSGGSSSSSSQTTGSGTICAVVETTSAVEIVASIRRHVQLLNPTDANNFLKRAFAAAVARSSSPSRPLAMMTGLSRGLVDGERRHQASGAATSCSLSEPSRAQRSDRYSALMVVALWKPLHSPAAAASQTT